MELSKNLLNQLTPYELEALKEIINELLGVKIAKTSTNHEIVEKEFHIEKCPHCGSKHFIKHAHRKGVQRYLCKNEKCKKTFGATNNTFLFSTQQSYETWINFIAYELLHLTLLETSQRIGVSKTGCFNLRHKFYNAIKEVPKKQNYKATFKSTLCTYQST